MGSKLFVGTKWHELQPDATTTKHRTAQLAVE